MTTNVRWLPWCVLGLPALPIAVACSDGPVTTAQIDGTGGTSSGGAAGEGGIAGAAGAPSTGSPSTSSSSGGNGGNAGTTSTTTAAPPGLGVGQDCSEDACRSGLACQND